MNGDMMGTLIFNGLIINPVVSRESYKNVCSVSNAVRQTTDAKLTKAKLFRT